MNPYSRRTNVAGESLRTQRGGLSALRMSAEGAKALHIAVADALNFQAKGPQLDGISGEELTVTEGVNLSGFKTETTAELLCCIRSLSFLFVTLDQTSIEESMGLGGMEEMATRRYRVITNNPSVAAKWPGSVEWVDGSVSDVFRCVRDHVHLGHRLLTHPLAGSVKPNESPYKSVIVTDDSMAGVVDYNSLRIIEGAVAVLRNLGPSRFEYIPPHVDSDFQLIDCCLMVSAVESLRDTAWDGWTGEHQASASRQS